MVLDAAAVLVLAAQCAPHVSPQTLLALARAESGLDPLAIGVNRGGGRITPARSLAEAAETADRLLAEGANLDLGLAQINSANLARLGLSVEAAFDPCRNLRASANVLSDAYHRERLRTSEPQAALRRALSIYNTGHPTRGLSNGYVGRVTAAAGLPTPLPKLVPANLGSPPKPAWAVFAATSATFVIRPLAAAAGAQP